MLNSSFFCGGLIRAIRPNLCVSDLSVFVWFQHDNMETDGTTPTLRFVARVEKGDSALVRILAGLNHNYLLNSSNFSGVLANAVTL